MHHVFATIRIALVAALFSLTGVAYSAPILWVGDSAGVLGTVDAATGSVQVVGSMGTVMTDIAFNPSGQLYGVSGGSLYSINAATASPTFIGNLGTSLNSLVFGADGTLYGANSALYTINTATGAASDLGNGGTSYSSSGDLAFVGGQLFLSSTSPAQDSLVQLDTATGAGTVIGAIGASGVYGLASADNITLYGVAGTEVFTVDTVSGVGTVLGSYAEQGLGTAYGTAFFSESAPPVPEPSTYLLMLAGLGMLGMVRGRLAAPALNVHAA